MIDKLSTDSGLSKADVGRVVEGVFETITGCLKTEDKVVVAGFGSFEISHRAARTGRNPRTGEPIPIPASKAPKFKAGKALKEAVN